MTANPGISEEELNAIYSAMDIFGVQGSLPTAADALSAAKQSGCSIDEINSHFNNFRTITQLAVKVSNEHHTSTLPAEQRMANLAGERQRSITQLASMLDDQGGIRDGLSFLHFMNFARQQRLSTVRCGIMRVIAATQQSEARARLDSSHEVALLLEVWFRQACEDRHATVTQAALQAIGSLQLGRRLPVQQSLFDKVLEASKDENIRVAAGAISLLEQWKWLHAQGVAMHALPRMAGENGVVVGNQNQQQQNNAAVINHHAQVSQAALPPQQQQQQQRLPPQVPSNDKNIANGVQQQQQQPPAVHVYEPPPQKKVKRPSPPQQAQKPAVPEIEMPEIVMPIIEPVEVTKQREATPLAPPQKTALTSAAVPSKGPSPSRMTPSEAGGVKNLPLPPAPKLPDLHQKLKEAVAVDKQPQKQPEKTSPKTDQQRDDERIKALFASLPDVKFSLEVEAGRGEESAAVKQLERLRKEPVKLDPDQPRLQPPAQGEPGVIPFVPVDPFEFEEQNAVLLAAGVVDPKYVKLPPQQNKS